MSSLYPWNKFNKARYISDFIPILLEIWERNSLFLRACVRPLGAILRYNSEVPEIMRPLTIFLEIVFSIAR